MTELLIPAVKMPECSRMVFLKNTTPSIARNPCAVCRAAMGHGKCGAVRWGERGWDGQSPLHTSPQLSVNNDSVQVGLYCFWLQAFYRNNCNSCQESFCPQLRGKNKEQRWECLHLILVPRKHPGRIAGVAAHRHGRQYSCVHSQLCQPSNSPACLRHHSCMPPPSELFVLTPITGPLPVLVFLCAVGGGMGATVCMQKSGDNSVELVLLPSCVFQYQRPGWLAFVVSAFAAETSRRPLHVPSFLSSA